MNCAKCGNPLKEGQRFCTVCGTPVLCCGKCGKPLKEGQKFCTACGMPVVPIVQTVPIPENEIIGDVPVRKEERVGVVQIALVIFLILLIIGSCIGTFYFMGGMKHFFPSKSEVAFEENDDNDDDLDAYEDDSNENNTGETDGGEDRNIMDVDDEDGEDENGILSSFKHFPGHGATVEDSHLGFAVSHRTMEELQANENWMEN